MRDMTGMPWSFEHEDRVYTLYASGRLGALPGSPGGRLYLEWIDQNANVRNREQVRALLGLEKETQ